MKKLKKAGYLEWFFLAFSYLRVYELEGNSMMPTYRPGARLLVDPLGTIGVGDVVVIRHPFKTDVLMFKRVESIEKDGSLFLRGDNTEPMESEDSRSFGSVSVKYLKGKAVAVLEND